MARHKKCTSKKCSLCLRKFPSQKELNDHMSIDHNEFKYICKHRKYGKHLFQTVVLRDISISINRWTFSVKFVVGNFLSSQSWLLIRQSTQRKRSSRASTRDVMQNTKQKLSIGDIMKFTGL